jgi:centriolar protein POC1
MAVFSTAYTPDGKYILIGSRDAQLKIWDAETFMLVKNIPAHLFAINHIAVHPTLPCLLRPVWIKALKFGMPKISDW